MYLFNLLDTAVIFCLHSCFSSCIQKLLASRDLDTRLLEEWTQSSRQEKAGDSSMEIRIIKETSQKQDRKKMASASGEQHSANQRWLRRLGIKIGSNPKTRSVTRFSRYEWRYECYLVRKMRPKLRTWAFVPSIRTKTSSKIAFFFGGFSTNWRYELEVRVRPAPKHSTMAAEGGRGGGDIVANTCTDAASSSSN